MIKLKDIIKESYAWERKFGESLPTIEDTTKRHSSKLVKEDARDIIQAKKLVQKLQTIEGKFRQAMNKLDDRFNADLPNQKLSKPLRASYLKNVTAFMREMLSLVKKMK
jgi:hypothetical protein|tara:strand:- start:1910 stop:2236 length:327 start_codon:yes stop_codon:yes gene_type:complete